MVCEDPAAPASNTVLEKCTRFCLFETSGGNSPRAANERSMEEIMLVVAFADTQRS